MSEDYRIIPFHRPVDGVYGHIDGVEVTDEVIKRLNESAEAGHPGVTARRVGHPSVISDTDTPGVVVQFRIDRVKLDQLDAKAKAENRTRSDMLRGAVDELLLSA
jgi:hypothetical protein